MEINEKGLKIVEDKQLAIVAKLRNIALQQMRKTGYSAQFYTLQRTEVADSIFADKTVIEKFDKLFSPASDEVDPAKVEEFIKFCTVKIKHCLIDHMRKKFAAKRGGDIQTISLDDSLTIFAALDIKDDQLEDLNATLEKFEKESAFHAKLVGDKYFLGMTNEEIAKQLDVSLSKIEKDSHYAIAWLKRELSK